jgi:hypothetical protein
MNILKKNLLSKSHNFMKKYETFSPFSVLVILLISLFVISLVKHQEISLKQQTIRIEVVGQNWANNHSELDGYNPPYWLLENLKIGMKDFSPDGRAISEIIDIEYYEGNDGVLRVFLVIRLEVVDSFGSGRTTYKGSNIEAGESIEFHFGGSLLLGQIINSNYSKENINIEKLLVTGIYKNISSQAANLINPGIRIVNPFNDDVYASVKRRRIYPSSDNIFYKVNNSSVLRLEVDHSLRNVEVEVELIVEEHLEEYYFAGNQAIRVGEEIFLSFPGLQLGLMEVTNVSRPSEVK